MSLVPQRHRREEVLNTLTHGAGLVASILGAFMLVGMAIGSHNPLEVPSVLIYCVTMVFVYLSSTLYHAVGHPETKSRLQVVDHCAIYLMIAGTYTPLLLLGLGGRSGWMFFGIIWTMAAAGVVFKYFFTGRMAVLSMVTYMAMGWLAIFIAKPLVASLPTETTAWIVAGGLSYTLGSVAFVSQRRYAHSVWHVFVIAGSACHFFAIAVGLPFSP